MKAVDNVNVNLYVGLSDEDKKILKKVLKRYTPKEQVCLENIIAYNGFFVIVEVLRTIPTV